MRGISPIIASILLIAFTVSASLMLSGWFSSFTTSTTSNVSFSAQSIVSCSAALIKANNVFLANGSNYSVFAVNEGNSDLQARASISSTNGSFCISDIYNVTRYNSTRLDIQNCTAKCSDFQKAMLMTNCPEISHSLTQKSKVYYNGVLCTACDSIGSGLVLNMTFSEGNSTNITDSSIYGNNGNYTGETFNNGTITAATWTTGKYGNGLSLQYGNSSYMNIPNSNSLNFETGAFTALLWVNTSYASRTGVLCKGCDWTNIQQWGILYANSPPLLFVIVGNGTYHLEYNTGLGSIMTWKLIGMMRDTNNKIYFINDGNITDTGSVVIGNVSNSANLLVGKDALDYYLNGSVDSIRIWNRSLSATEISAEMNSSRPVSGDKLVGAWEMEEASGNVTYDTHNWVAGKVGAALGFDGVNDYVNCGNGASLQVTNVATLSAWIKTTASGIAPGLQVMNKRNVNGDTSPTLLISVGATGVAEAIADGDGYYSGAGGAANVKDGNWHHVVGTFSNGVINVFVDGKLDGTGSWDNRTLSNSNSNWNIGYHGAWNSYFNGSIDEVKIYNRALTENEIKGNYYMVCG